MSRDRGRGNLFKNKADLAHRASSIFGELSSYLRIFEESVIDSEIGFYTYITYETPEGFVRFAHKGDSGYNLQMRSSGASG